MAELNILTFVLITPDDEWHQRPRKEMAEPSSNGPWMSEDEWRRQFYAIAERYPTPIAVRVYVHDC
jgi:hypothetical protein